MLHTKTFMIALITAGCLAAPAANAGYPPPPTKCPESPKNDCKDIKLKELKLVVKTEYKDEIKVKVEGKLKGLKKNEDAKVTVKVEGKAEFKCKNPNGQLPPGQQPGDVPFKLTGWQKVKADGDGKAEFDIKTEALDTYGICKPPPFKTVLKEIEIDTVTVIVEQKDCKVKFECPVPDPAKSGDPIWVDVEDCERSIISS